MKKLGFILLFILAASFNLIAQQLFSEQQGKVTQNEMDMVVYEKDPDAEALIIYDLGEYSIREDSDGRLVLEMRMRKKIKILKQAGIKYADFEIPFYVEGQKPEVVNSITATTYNWIDGKLIKTELDPKKIFEEVVSDEYRIKKIALSDVREGSVIETSYTITTPYFQHMRSWFFQNKIPVIHSKLIYNAIPYYEYAYIIKGISKMDEFESKVSNSENRYGPYTYKVVTYTFGLSDVPAFKDEEFISSTKDYIASLHFQMTKINYPTGGIQTLISTWPDICKSLLSNDYFGKYMKQSEKEGTKIVPQLGLDDKTPTEKLELLTQYVKDSYKWDGFYSKYADDKLSDFLKQKTGNAANLNLYLIGLLRASNIDAFPIILSTRKNGAIPIERPFAQFFNYVIAGAEIDGRIYLLDATEPFLHYTSLPEQCIDVLGLIVKPKLKEAEWIETKQLNKMQTTENFQINLDPENSKMNIRAMFTSNGNNAFMLRKEYAGSENNLKKYYKKRNNIEIEGEIKVNNYETTNKPFSITFSSSTNLETNNQKIFVHPFCNLSLSSNPFKQTSRNLPVDLIYLIGENYNSSIIIPKEYKVEYIPSAMSIDNDIMTFNYSVNTTGNIVNIAGSYSLKKNIYDASQYNDLKTSYTKVIQQLSEMVILSKEDEKATADKEL